MQDEHFAIADRIAINLTTNDTDYNEVAKASAYLNQVRDVNDFFDWLAWMATDRVSQQLARSRLTPEYYKNINRACQQLKVIDNVNIMAQTLAWAVRLMRYHPVAKPVTAERTIAMLTATVQAKPRSTETTLPTMTKVGPNSMPIRIRDLQPGMELQGTVKRVAQFGAFVDIGVGRDGLVHISRLREGYVGRVDEVVQPEQAVTVWVTEVNAGQGRISLTMVRPPQTQTTTLEVITPPPVQPAKPEPLPRPAPVRISSVDEVKPGLWVLGTVTKVDINRLVIDIGLPEAASLTFDRLPGQPTDRDEVAETWPAGKELEARVVSINPRRRVQLTLK